MDTGLLHETDEVLWNRPLNELPDFVDGLQAYDKLHKTHTQDNLVRELDAIVGRATLLATYIGWRQGGQDRGHSVALKEANRRYAKVRKVLTYHTTPEVSF